MLNRAQSSTDNKDGDYFDDVEDRAHRIVEAIQKGNKAAEKALVTHYWKGLFFVLNKRANNPELVQDIAQDTFIITIEKIRKGELRQAGSLNGFVRQTGVNLLLAHYRKETRRATDCAEQIGIELPDHAIAYFELLNSRKVLALVQQCLNELDTERDKLLIQNYFIYEKSKIQICQDFDIDSAHFDRVLYRARARLKKVIFNLLPDQSDDHEHGKSGRKESIASLLSLLIIANAGYLQSDFHQTIESNETASLSPHTLFSLITHHKLGETSSVQHLLSRRHFLQENYTHNKLLPLNVNSNLPSKLGKI